MSSLAVQATEPAASFVFPQECYSSETLWLWVEPDSTSLAAEATELVAPFPLHRCSTQALWLTSILPVSLTWRNGLYQSRSCWPYLVSLAHFPASHLDSVSPSYRLMLRSHPHLQEERRGCHFYCVGPDSSLSVCLWCMELSCQSHHPSCCFSVHGIGSFSNSVSVYP